MDPNNFKEFLPEFIKAASGHVAALENSIQLLQTNSSESKTLEQAHIGSHSLKGECNAMGFVKTGDLAKLLELYFKSMIEKKVSLNSDGAELLRRLLVSISESLNKIEKTGVETDTSKMFAEFSEKTGVNRL